MKRLTWAEAAAIVICVLFMTLAALQRFLPAGGDDAFRIESSAAAESVLTSEPHYIDGKLCINSATENELMQLPGVGEKLAQRIVEYREENGPFLELDELDNVYGIGENILNGIREYLTVEEYDEDSGG